MLRGAPRKRGQPYSSARIAGEVYRCVLRVKFVYEHEARDVKDCSVDKLRLRVAIFNIHGKSAAEAERRCDSILMSLFSPTSNYLGDDSYSMELRTFRTASLGRYVRREVLVMPSTCSDHGVSGRAEVHLRTAQVLGPWRTWENFGYAPPSMEAPVEAPDGSAPAASQGAHGMRLGSGGMYCPTGLLRVGARTWGQLVLRDSCTSG